MLILILLISLECLPFGIYIQTIDKKKLFILYHNSMQISTTSIIMASLLWKESYLQITSQCLKNFWRKGQIPTWLMNFKELSFIWLVTMHIVKITKKFSKYWSSIMQEFKNLISKIDLLCIISLSRKISVTRLIISTHRLTVVVLNYYLIIRQRINSV